MAPYDDAREIGEGIFFSSIQPPSLHLKEGKFELSLAKPPALWYRVLYFLFGYTALGFGLYILINGIIYGRYIQLH